jgi:Uma2 family endonuclease
MTAHRMTTNGPKLPLVHGQRMTQPEFHRRYEAMPEDFKAELIGGVVYVPSPARRPHGLYQTQLALVLGLYHSATPGVEALTDATTILGDFAEPQPDQALRILPECGGQSWTDPDQWVRGAPELLAAVSHATKRLDLNERKADYEHAGVVEYIVVLVEDQELLWFDLRTGEQLKPDRRGVFRSAVFPGLWIHGPALLARDSRRLIATLERGLASPEHAAFVRRLRAARRRRKKE